MMIEAQFPGVPQSVVSARRFAAAALTGVPGEVAEVVALIASELASNSVRHAASAFEVRVEQLPDQIHIEVEDDGDGEPTVRAPGLTEVSGRGLQIVQALADEWGVVPRPDTTGKTVWVKIALRTTDDEERARVSDEAGASGRGRRTGRGTGSPGVTSTLSPLASDRHPAGAPAWRSECTRAPRARNRWSPPRPHRRGSARASRQRRVDRAWAAAANAAAPARHVSSRSDPGG